MVTLLRQPGAVDCLDLAAERVAHVRREPVQSIPNYGGPNGPAAVVVHFVPPTERQATVSRTFALRRATFRGIEFPVTSRALVHKSRAVGMSTVSAASVMAGEFIAGGEFIDGLEDNAVVPRPGARRP